MILPGLITPCLKQRLYGKIVKMIKKKKYRTLGKNLQRNYELVTLVSKIEASEQYRTKLKFWYAILVGQSFVN